MFKTEYYKDIKTVSVNKEKPRTSFVSHDDREEALSHVTEFDQTPYYINLNGKWEFYFNEYPKNVPSDIATNVNQNDPTWCEIEVPGNWELQGHGTAIYTDGNYDFCPRNPSPPYLPDRNPTGVYRRRDIEIPDIWIEQERDIFLQIGGARGGLYVYINGQEIGYSEDTKNPADFLINKFIHKGQNAFTFLIHKYCTGSYLEDQDMWRLGGLERDVVIYSQPKIHMRDFESVTTLDDTYENGLFYLKVYLVNHKENENVDLNVEYELIDTKNDNKTVFKDEKSLTIEAGIEKVLEFDEKKVPNVRKWSAEHPNLYILLITIKKDSNILEIVPFRVGFRREEFTTIEEDGMQKSVLLFNGKPVIFKGVNIHEHNEKTGHYVTDEIRLKDIELLKKNNFNALRFSHYPQCRQFYEMCDEFGFYVYSESNIESHGMGFMASKTLANKPIWLKAHMERTKNMYERSKNHACVTFFSLGNEAGNGSNFDKAYEYIKKREKGAQNRPVNYECVHYIYRNTDMNVLMYPTAYLLKDLSTDEPSQPIIPCEYAHSMGNSDGNFNLIWKMIYKYTNLQGGFIWDWVDQGLLETGKNGKKYWAFGGDYGENEPSSGNFCINGLVSPDRTPHPAMAEVKYSQQNIGFEAIDLKKGIFKITNRFFFTDLSDFEIILFIKANEKVLKEVDLSKINSNLSSLKPQESIQIDLFTEIDQLKPALNTEYFLNFSVLAKSDNQPFIPKGFEVAHDQFILPIDQIPKTVKHEVGPQLSILESEEKVVISNSKVEFEFSKIDKIVKSFKVDGFEYISDGFGFQPNFWRGPTDNDYGNKTLLYRRLWKKLSRKFTIKKCETKINENVVTLTVVYDLDNYCEFDVIYTILGTGIIKIEGNFINRSYEEEEEKNSKEEEEEVNYCEDNHSDESCIPRIGIRFRIPKELNNVTYFGRGPEENYSDRCCGTEIDLFKTTAEDLYFPYVRPQENGHHIDIRWLAVYDKSKKGLLVFGDNKFEFNALRNPVEDFDDENQKDLKYQYHNFGWDETGKNRLRRQHHIDDVIPQDYVEINLDLKQEGVAGYNSWGDKPVGKNAVSAYKNHSYKLTIIPINNEDEIPEKLAYSYE